MLDAIHPWGRKIRPFCPDGIIARVAQEEWERAAHFRIREEIFVREQGICVGSDRDEQDQHALPIVALSPMAAVGYDAVGVVRISPSIGDTWYGGRLGVCAAYRRVGAIGTALITCAVSTAHAAGCQEFLATIQPQNVRYFERHHFAVRGEVQVLGQPHVLMEADLGSYPSELSQSPISAHGGRGIRAA